MKIRALCAYPLVVMLLLSCGKMHEFPSEAEHIFINSTNARITLDVYGNQRDYGMNANRASRNMLEPGGVAHVTLRTGQHYWLDWYSADYSINNWQNQSEHRYHAQPSPEFIPAEMTDTTILMASGRDTARSIFTNGGADTVSYWAGQLTDSNGLTAHYQFTFYKDFRCLFTAQYPDGTVKRIERQYYINESVYDASGRVNIIRAFLVTSTKVDGYYVTIVYGVRSFDKKVFSRDTLLVSYVSSTPAFRQEDFDIVRQ